MNCRKTLTIIMALSMILGSYRSFAQTAEELFPKAIQLEEVKGELEKAIEIYQTIVTKFPANRPIASKALLHIGLCYEKLGNSQARKAYERVVSDFADQTENVALARVKLAALGGSSSAGGLISRRILTDASGIGESLTTDGKYINKLDGKNGDVIQFEVASGKTSRITNKGPWGEWPARVLEGKIFSHNGKQIAYSWFTKDEEYQLQIRHLDGSDFRTIYSKKESYIRPLDWSPDEKFILSLLSTKSAIQMILISTEDGSINVLRNIPSGLLTYQNALFSTDGKNIAFCSLGVGNPPHSDIFSMSLDSRDTVSIASHPAEDQLLQWAPDGKSLIFLSDRSGTWDIWSVRINGGKQQGEPELLKKDFDSDLWGGLGFTKGGSFYYKTHNNSGRIFKGEIDLETGKVLVPPFPVKTRYNGLPTQLTWSPDGNKLLYLSERGSIGIGKNTITIQSATTGEELLLSPRFCYINQIFWVPDGNSVIARGWMVAGGGIYKINAETSEITKLPDGGMIPKLCPDGKTMVFGVVGPKIIKLNLDTSEETELVKAGNLHYDLSPDGKEIVFQVDDAVKKIPLIGGASQELFRDSLANYYGLEWTKDGRNIIVQTFGNSGCEIWSVPATGGTPIKLDLTYPHMGDFTINPDNRRFAFATDEGAKEELWVLENLLPK